MLIKKILPLLIAAFLPGFLLAQVTTSSITGTVKLKNGTQLEGASVTAVHLPSGSKYVGVSKRGGVFTLPGLRPGGPYQVTISYVGVPAQTLDNITLLLGDAYSINVVLDDQGTKLSDVTVSAINARRHAAVDKIGVSTNISNRQIMTLPSITRSITDFTRITPQANGTSFGGRDGRYNNTQIDGANLNNGFGLSSDPLPGGGVMPISIDAIQEISVNISPYDVRQSNFTGAGISAITKSGDNTLKGTIYGFYRDQSFNGTHVKDFTLPAFQSTSNKTWGASLGGPIIKNKLFFFVNYESEEKTAPGIQFRPAQAGLSGSNVSSTSIDSLSKLYNYAKSAFNYDAGSFDNFPNFVQKDNKFLIKLDWNISTKTKLTVKYSDLENKDQIQENASSIDGTGLPKGVNPLVPNGFSRMPNSRFGPASMSFFNSNYGTNYSVKTGSLELNSSFTSRLSNQFITTYTRSQSTRYVPGGVVFPTVDILNNNAQNYLSIGTDPFTKNNDIINEIFTITDNLSYYVGKHSITGGISYEYQRYGNMFMAGAQSYYVFNTLNDFVTNQAPVYYAYTYSLLAGQPAVYSANLKVGQLGAYLQDEFTVNDRVKLNYGLRVEMPSYIGSPLTNPTIQALTFPDKNGNPTHYNTGLWPTPTPYFSPRAGFRWDVNGDKSLTIRGGMGLFTGRIPYVFLTNMPSNSFMYQATASITNPAQLQGYKFNPNPDAQIAAHPADFPNTAGGPLPAGPGLVFINPNFKFPQVFRMNLGFDKRIGNSGFTWGMEAMFTKDINAVWMRNANQSNPGLTLSGADNRPYYGSASNKINSAIGTAIVLENTNQGLSFSYTAQISKAPTKGFYGSLAYTYTFAADVTANPGSTASSVWNANATTLTQNDLQLAYSQYAVPHRLVANLSYRIEYAKHLATTVSMFLQGQAQGTFSYTYSGDVNGDGNSQDLMYIPKNPSEITFVALAASGTTPAFTAQQQSDAFFQYIAQDKYLSSHQGRYAERNGVVQPFYLRADMRILQDLFTNIGGRRHSLQLSIDIIDLPNLLSKYWGVQKFFVSSTPLIFKSIVNGQPTFNLRTFNNALMNSTYIDDQSVNSTWGAQIGLRYTF